MSRLFHSPKDINLFNAVNKEMLTNIVDTSVDIYLFDKTFAETDIYNDVENRFYYGAVPVGGFIEHPEADIDFDNLQEETLTIEVKFHKNTLSELDNLDTKLNNGDLIGYDDKYFKIIQIVDNQFIGGQTYLRHSLICYCVQTIDSKEYIDKVDNYVKLQSDSNDYSEIITKTNSSEILKGDIYDE